MFDSVFFFTTIVLAYILDNQKFNQDGSWSVTFAPTLKNFVGLTKTLALTILLLFIE